VVNRPALGTIFRAHKGDFPPTAPFSERMAINLDELGDAGHTKALIAVASNDGPDGFVVFVPYSGEVVGG